MWPQVVGFTVRIQTELREAGLASHPGPEDMQQHPAGALGATVALRAVASEAGILHALPCALAV